MAELEQALRDSDAKVGQEGGGQEGHWCDHATLTRIVVLKQFLKGGEDWLRLVDPDGQVCGL